SVTLSWCTFRIPELGRRTRSYRPYRNRRAGRFSTARTTLGWGRGTRRPRASSDDGQGLLTPSWTGWLARHGAGRQDRTSAAVGSFERPLQVAGSSIASVAFDSWTPRPTVERPDPPADVTQP